MRLIAPTTGSIFIAGGASVVGSNASPLLGRPYWFSFRTGPAASGAGIVYDDSGGSTAGRERLYFQGSGLGGTPLVGPIVPACGLWISLSAASMIVLTRA